MTRHRALAALLVAAALSVSCGERDPDDVAGLFARRVGQSPDAGLYRQGLASGEWDHVATIHGMVDDLELCESIVQALRVREPKNRYSCRQMN